MTAAALLAKYPDIDVHLFESKPEIRAIGAGIAVWKRFWDIFEEYMDMDRLCSSRGIRCTPWSEGKSCNHTRRCGICSH
jgi:salicylate hydroxylase